MQARLRRLTSLTTPGFPRRAVVYGLMAVHLAGAAGSGAELKFRHHYIDRDLPGDSYGQTVLVDVDRDGDLDFITGGKDQAKSVYLENLLVQTKPAGAAGVRGSGKGRPPGAPAGPAALARLPDQEGTRRLETDPSAPTTSDNSPRDRRP